MKLKKFKNNDYVIRTDYNEKANSSRPGLWRNPMVVYEPDGPKAERFLMSSPNGKVEGISVKDYNNNYTNDFALHSDWVSLERFIKKFVVDVNFYEVNPNSLSIGRGETPGVITLGKSNGLVLTVQPNGNKVGLVHENEFKNINPVNGKERTSRYIKKESVDEIFEADANHNLKKAFYLSNDVNPKDEYSNLIDSYKHVLSVFNAVNKNRNALNEYLVYHMLTQVHKGYDSKKIENLNYVEGDTMPEKNFLNLKEVLHSFEPNDEMKANVNKHMKRWVEQVGKKQLEREEVLKKREKDIKLGKKVKPMFIVDAIRIKEGLKTIDFVNKYYDENNKQQHISTGMTKSVPTKIIKHENGLALVKLGQLVADKYLPDYYYEAAGYALINDKNEFVASKHVGENGFEEKPSWIKTEEYMEPIADQLKQYGSNILNYVPNSVINDKDAFKITKDGMQEFLNNLKEQGASKEILNNEIAKFNEIIENAKEQSENLENKRQM